MEPTTTPRRAAETASAAMMGVAAFLALAWLWTVVRSQQNAEEFRFALGAEEGSASLVDRLDLAFQSTFLLAHAAVVAGLAVLVGLIDRRGNDGAGTSTAT